MSCHPGGLLSRDDEDLHYHQVFPQLSRSAFDKSFSGLRDGPAASPSPPLRGLTDNVFELLGGWNERAQGAQRTHAVTAQRFERLHWILGVPVVVLTAVAGTSVFAALGQEVSLSARIAVAAVSILAAVLAALQTFLRYSERAESHRRSAAGFASFRRELEITNVKLKRDPAAIPDALLASLQQRLDGLLGNAPSFAFLYGHYSSNLDYYHRQS